MFSAAKFQAGSHDRKAGSHDRKFFSIFCINLREGLARAMSTDSGSRVVALARAVAISDTVAKDLENLATVLRSWTTYIDSPILVVLRLVNILLRI